MFNCCQVVTLKLQENIIRGYKITTVHAEDADSNLFGEVRYFIPSSGNSQTALDLIDVDPISGDVTLKQSLDREKHNK